MPSKPSGTKVERSLRSLNNTLLQRLRAAEAKAAAAQAAFESAQAAFESAQAAATNAEQRILALRKCAADKVVSTSTVATQAASASASAHTLQPAPTPPSPTYSAVTACNSPSSSPLSAVSCSSGPSREQHDYDGGERLASHASCWQSFVDALSLLFDALFQRKASRKDETLPLIV